MVLKSLICLQSSEIFLSMSLVYVLALLYFLWFIGLMFSWCYLF